MTLWLPGSAPWGGRGEVWIAWTQIGECLGNSMLDQNRRKLGYTHSFHQSHHNSAKPTHLSCIWVSNAKPVMVPVALTGLSKRHSPHSCWHGIWSKSCKLWCRLVLRLPVEERVPLSGHVKGCKSPPLREVMANLKPSWSPWDANDLIVLFKVVQTGWFQLWKPLLPWPSSLVAVVGELCLLYFLSQQRLFDYFISHCGSVLCPRGIFHLEGPAWAFTQPHVSYEGTLRQMDHQYHVVSPFHLVHSSDFARLELVETPFWVAWVY